MEQSCRSEGAGTFPILNSGLVRPNSLFGFFLSERQEREVTVSVPLVPSLCLGQDSGTMRGWERNLSLRGEAGEGIEDVALLQGNEDRYLKNG